MESFFFYTDRKMGRKKGKEQLGPLKTEIKKIS